MKKIFSIVVVLAILIGTYSFTPLNNLDNWFKAGSNPNGYETRLDTSTFYTGVSSAIIESKEKKTKGFGTLMQSCSAKNYLGKRVKLSGYLKTENVKKWAGLWFRVDGENQKRVLSFENMRQRKIKGTTDWTKHEITLDVPKNALSLNFGSLIVGSGKVWFDNISFEVVADLKRKDLVEPKIVAPSNLDFEN
ncbi:MAG: hypothetical protein ACI840_001389 [Ulvibacter sp.]|jgi:hypothetical protein